MEIRDTEYLSQLSIEELKTVHKKWPNPTTLTVLLFGFMIGSGYFLTSNLKSLSPMELIGAISVFLFAIFIMLVLAILTFVKLAKAKKQLRTYAEARSLPPKLVIKEFVKYNVKIARELKSS